MYYAIQVAPKEEKAVVLLIKSAVPKNICKSCFYISRRVRKKFHGEWQERTEALIPGYIFVETEDILCIHDVFPQYSRFAKVVGHTDDEFIPLSENDTAWLIKMMQSGFNYEIPLSKVTVADGIVNVVDGPLTMMQSLIRKFNLHKRIAEVEMDFLNNKVVIFFGIEIIGGELHY